jgi:hypothetical protein
MPTFGSTRTLQTSFSSGELSPALHARIDLNRYVSGLKTCLNFLVRAHGGAANRSGTTNVGGVKSFLPCRLLPFSFSTEQTYILEATDQAFRWFTGGKRLTVPKTDAAIENGSFDFNIDGWDDLSTGAAEIQATGRPKRIEGGTPRGNFNDGAGMGQAFNGDESQSYGESVRASDSEDAWIGMDWGVGVTKTVTRIRLVGTSDSGFKTGGDPSSLLFIVEGSNDDFESYTRIWDRVTSDGVGKIIDDDDGIDLSTPYRYHRLRILGGADDKDMCIAQVGFFETLDSGKMLLVGADGETARAHQAISLGSSYRGKRHGMVVQVSGEPTLRLFVRIGKEEGGDDILNDKELRPGRHTFAFWPSGSVFHVEFREADGNTVGLDYVGLIASGTSETSNPLELPHQYLATQLRSIKYVQSADVMTLVHPRHPIRELRRYGPYDWSLLEPAFAPGPPQPSASEWSLVKDGDGNDTVYRYKITYEYASGEEGPPSAEKQEEMDTIDQTHKITILVDYPFPVGVVKANVYKYKAGTFGFIGVVEDAAGLLENTPLNPLADDTPTVPRNPFDDPGEYPAAVGFFEQRRFFGGSDEAPDTIEGSQTALYSNFAKSEPTKDSDAITATLSSTQVNRIRHLVGMQALLIGTSGGWWKLARGDKGLTPAMEGGISKQGSIGVSEIAPLEVGNVLLWITKGERSVRELGYDFSSDAFGGGELSLLSTHLLEGHRLVEWTWQQDPLSAVWLVRDDGVLLCMTYNREQEVIGWSRHVTDGQYESIACVSETEGDVVYVVVRRRVNGAWRRQIERFASRIVRDLRDSHFVDCGVVVDLPVPVIGITLGGILDIRAPNHGCVAGSIVEVSEVTGPTQVNDRQYTVRSTSGSHLDLVDLETGLDVDTSTWPEWTGGGYIRKAVSTVSGLGHLIGKTVSILADGNVHPQQIVGGSGIVTLDAPACRVHVGLPYVSELETLALPMPPEQYGRRKRLTAMQLHISQSRSVRVAASPEQGQEPEWEELAQRTNEAWDLPTRLASGRVDLPLPQKWQATGQGLIQQVEPLPLEVLAVEASVDVGG